MMWQYRTIVFEFAKDGLLGEKYIDDESMEAVLNEQGMMGWELAGVVTVQEGVLAVLKRERKGVAAEEREEQAMPARPMDKEDEVIEENREITAEDIGRREQEHIRRLEESRRKAMEQHERDRIGDIKIS